MSERPDVDHVLAATSRLRPLDFLCNRPWEAVVVADGNLHPRIEQAFLARTCRFSRYNRLRQRLPTWFPRQLLRYRSPLPLLLKDNELKHAALARGPIFVCSFVDEPGLIERTRQHFPERRVLGLVSDVLTRHAAKIGSSPHDPDSLERRARDDSVRPQTVYAIVCTPRSGSTFLADVLASNGGLGRPDEHLKNSVISLYRHRHQTGFDFSHWLRLTLAAHTDEGVFATKIISGFLFGLDELLEPADRAVLAHVFRDCEVKLVHLIRHNKAAQAVSSYVASQSMVWHLKDPQGYARAEAAAGKIPYDFGDIYRIYRRFSRHEAKLSRLTDDSPFPVRRLYYEDLIESPERELYRLVEWLDPDTNRPSIVTESRLERVSARLGHEIRVQFERDLAKIEHPQNEEIRQTSST